MKSVALKTAQVFSSNMVLQRDKHVLVWGEAADGKEVSLSFNGYMLSTKVINCNWQMELPCMKAGGPYDMKVTDGETTIQYENIMVGEVWLASGQSNIELELQNCLKAKEEMKLADYDSIRFYNVAKIATLDESNLKEEATRSWRIVKPDDCADMSAIAYFLARKLTKELGITIGIIDCYWGGTSISCWMDQEFIEQYEPAHIYLEEWDKKVDGKTDEQYDNEMVEYQKLCDIWSKKVDEVKSKDPDTPRQEITKYSGEFPWPPPFGNKSQFRPAGLYKTMVQRICPYTVKGVVWYQGEEDAPKAYLYDKMLYHLIELWRRDWKDDELPFQIIQLPMWIEEGQNDDKCWAELREKQHKVAVSVKNVELTVQIDCGEYDNIHPVDKKTVGERLGQQILENIYGVKNLYAKCPMYKQRDLKENKIVLYFDYVYDGFLLKDGKDVPLFEIAGDNKVFKPADVSIDGNTLIISNKSIKNPKYARYAWVNYGIVNLFNTKGMPVAPFETK